jgi:hypothetical protein
MHVHINKTRHHDLAGRIDNSGFRLPVSACGLFVLPWASGPRTLDPLVHLKDLPVLDENIKRGVDPAGRIDHSPSCN